MELLHFSDLLVFPTLTEHSLFSVNLNFYFTTTVVHSMKVKIEELFLSLTTLIFGVILVSGTRNSNQGVHAC